MAATGASVGTTLTETSSREPTWAGSVTTTATMLSPPDREMAHRVIPAASGAAQSQTSSSPMYQDARRSSFGACRSLTMA